MLRLLTDENLNGDVLRGLLLRNHELDIVRAQDTGLEGEPDPQILAWAANQDRIVLTHDRATMPDDAYQRIAAGQRMPGVFVVSDRLSIGQAIEEILLINEYSDHAEWNGRVVYLPL
jgi:hypothetical protein